MSSSTVKICTILVNLVYLGTSILLFFKGAISMQLLIALVFLQSLIMGLLLFNYILYIKFQDLAKGLGFRYLTLFLEQPRMEGKYKNNTFQLHFKQMERGEVTGMLRSYIKLQWKEDKFFDDKILEKYTNYRYKSNKIISIDHIVRTYKNYLLLRREWFTFDKKNICDLMDLLIKVSKEAEISKKKK